MESDFQKSSLNITAKVKEWELHHQKSICVCVCVV